MRTKREHRWLSDGEALMASKGLITAEELMKKLKANPDWVRRMRERDRKHRAEVAKLQAEIKPEHKPLLRDLAAVGIRVRRISELVMMDAPYPKAIPVLLRHLPRARHPVIRDCIARSLTVREAEGVASGPILQELKVEQNHDVRWAMANALTIIAVPDDADEIARLVDDPAFEDVRERLSQALRNLRPPSGRRPRSLATRLGARRPRKSRSDPPRP
jgi:hypothetical protein